MSSDQSNVGGTSGQDSTLLDDIRPLIIQELRAESLAPAEQDQLIVEIGEALLERATMALMESLPSEVLIEFSAEEKKLQDPETARSFMQRVAEHVPDAQGIVIAAIKEGLKDYQTYLDEEMARRSVE